MSEWISVNDSSVPKPPLMDDEDSISVPVLLYIPEWAHAPWNSAVVMGNYLHRSKKFRPAGSTGWADRVTHWMPLPAPPK